MGGDASPRSTQNNNTQTKAFPPSTKTRESQNVPRKSSWLQVWQMGDDETVRKSVVIILKLLPLLFS